jgi:DNA-binding transcriptional regulator LsrR (DeoR family)
VGKTVEKYFNTCNHKEQHITLIPALGGVGRTVEKYLTHGITQRAAHHFNPAL